jgi:pyruvate,water dikinase
MPAGPPLPVAFRLQATGEPRAVVTGPVAIGRDGLPASAGRASGAACHDPARIDPDGRSVLVVDTLDPRLAAVLGNVAAIVSETGSALSHLAIVARELGVPAVVAVPDARRRFPAGSTVLVDGGAGEVELLTGEVHP